MGPRFNFRHAALLFLASLLLCGCSGGPKFVDARGVVTLAGKPVDNAAVTFEPVAGGPIATANTDAQGQFTLVTSDRAGLIPGDYRVAVTKYEVLNIDMSKPGDFSTLDVRWIVPERYSRPDTSKLSVQLQADTDDLHLDLQAE